MEDKDDPFQEELLPLRQEIQQIDLKNMLEVIAQEKINPGVPRKS